MKLTFVVSIESGRLMRNPLLFFIEGHDKGSSKDFPSEIAFIEAIVENGLV